jgi:hypothetical protein
VIPFNSFFFDSSAVQSADSAFQFGFRKVLWDFSDFDNRHSSIIRQKMAKYFLIVMRQFKVIMIILSVLSKDNPVLLSAPQTATQMS